MLIFVLFFIFKLIQDNTEEVVDDVLDQPRVTGEFFGPLIHVFSRISPTELSNLQSNSFQGLTNPRMTPTEILVYNISGENQEEQIRARVIQGILNREKPILYLIDSENDEFWLSQISAKKNYITGLSDSNYSKIKYDPENIKQIYLAVTLSGIHNAIPVTDADKPLFDLTELSNKELYALMLESFEDSNKQMISFRSKLSPSHIDFVVKNKMFLSPLAITDESTFLTLKFESRKEAKIIEEIFSQMESDCAMVGYNINPGIAGEFETINYLSKQGCFSVPVPSVPNLSFFSGLTQSEPKHIDPKTTTKLEDKVYVVFLMSDADNLEISYSKYEKFTQNHTTPIGWSISPLLNEFAPTIFDYYSSNLAETDTFIAAPSGGGFGYPSKNKYLPAFIEHTNKFMQETKLNYIWVLDYPIRGYSPELLQKFSEISDGMFMEYVILRSYEQSIESYNDKPAIFSAGFVDKDGKIAKRVIKSTPKQRPAFLFIGLEVRYNSPEHIDAEVAKLDSEIYEIVSVPEFMELIKQNGNAN